MKFINPNYIRTEDDIRTNEEHWTQKISLIEFNDKHIEGTPQKGKICWTRNYKKIPHWQRYNVITKWYKNGWRNYKDRETAPYYFPRYSCKIIKNEVNEIELYTKNAFGLPAEIDWEGKDLIRKIRKKLGEEIRRNDKELLEWLELERERDSEDGSIIEFPGAEFEPEADVIEAGPSQPKPDKGKGKARQYQEKPEKKEIPELTKEEERLLKDYRQELKELGKSNDINDFLTSQHAYLYREEYEELRKLKTKKAELGTNQIQKPYDLGRPDLALIWNEQLYFIIDFAYVNNWKMSCWIRARKCKLGLYYWNWQREAGRGTIELAPPSFIKESEPNEDGTPKNLMQSSRMHYEFCGELGVKRIYQSDFTTYQPRFALFEALGGETRNPSWSVKKERKGGGNEDTLLIPSDVHIKQLPDMKGPIAKALGGDTADQFADFFKLPFLLAGTMLKEVGKVLGKIACKIATLGLANSEIDDAFAGDETADSINLKLKKVLNSIMGAKVYLNIGPREHDKGGSFFSKMYNLKEVLFKEKPDNNTTADEAKVARTYKRWFKEQPHLWDHTTLQFYLFNNITMMGNGQFLGIQYDKELDNFVLPYHLFVNFAPGVLMYRWEFKYITVKCEIKCVGTFQDNFNLARVITSISVLGCGFGLNAKGVNVNSLKDASEIKDANAPQQEQHGERMFKSTMFDTLNKSIEPAMFSGNTIDFHYTLGEFFCRLTEPLWFYRIELSELLYNNLRWCNAKCKILYLPLEWEELIHWTQGKLSDDGKDTRNLGFFKWRGVALENDYDGFFTEIMNNGYWLDGGEKKKNPRLTYQRQEGYVKEGGNEWDTYEAEEEYIEKEIITEVQKTDHADSYDNITKHDNRVLFTTTPYIKNESGQDVLLGLLQQTPNWNGGSGYSGWTYGGAWSKDFTLPAGKYDYMWKVWTGPSKSGEIESIDKPIKVKISMRSGGGIGVGDGTVDIDFEWTATEKKIIRESVFKEKKTTTQEVDIEALEQEGEYEEEEIGEQELGENEVEQEEAEGGEGNASEKDRERENEREKEKEQEGEGEQEQEGEKEDETEKEDESEKEKEKEKEKEREKEKEKAKEQEQESEGEQTEDEGEDEQEA